MFDAMMRVELIDPRLGQIRIAGFFLGTHGHEEFAELLIAAGAYEEVLSETIV